MLDLIRAYNEKCAANKALHDELDAKIEQAEKRVKRLEAKRDKLGGVYWTDEIVHPLGKLLSGRLGLPYEVYGPFGLGCATSIYFRKDMTKSITEQPTKSITLRPQSGADGVFTVHYETGERTGVYAENTIGKLNGFDKITKELPDTIDEIIPLLRDSEACI